VETPRLRQDVADFTAAITAGGGDIPETLGPAGMTAKHVAPLGDAR